MDSRQYPIDKEQFEKLIEPQIKTYYKREGRPVKISHYQFFCGVLYVLRTGTPWRDLPSCYGKWHTIYTRFNRWSMNGLFWQLLYKLQQQKQVRIPVVFVDSTTVLIHRHGSGALKKKDLKRSAEVGKG